MAARREGRRSLSPTRLTPQSSFDYSVESERPVSSSRRLRPESLRTNIFSPLRVIAERDGEHSTTSMQIQDIENGEDDLEVQTRNGSSKSSRRGASKETGV